MSLEADCRRRDGHHVCACSEVVSVRESSNLFPSVHFHGKQAAPMTNKLRVWWRKELPGGPLPCCELLAFSRRQVLQRQAIDLNSVTSGLISFLDKVISKNAFAFRALLPSFRNSKVCLEQRSLLGPLESGIK